AAENREHFLERARCAIAVEIVGERSAAARDRVAKHGAGRAHDRVDLGASQPMAAPSGTNAGVKEDFVCVDIADTSQNALVGKRGLHVSPGTAEPGAECLGLQAAVQRLWPQAGELVERVGLRDPHPSEAARIAITERYLRRLFGWSKSRPTGATSGERSHLGRL